MGVNRAVEPPLVGVLAKIGFEPGTCKRQNIGLSLKLASTTRRGKFSVIHDRSALLPTTFLLLYGDCFNQRPYAFRRSRIHAKKHELESIFQKFRIPGRKNRRKCCGKSFKSSLLLLYSCREEIQTIYSIYRERIAL
eukprot:IDg5064t1